MQTILKGMPKRMAVLDYGLFEVREDRRIIGICGYLVQTDAGENVLIDTGFPPKYARDAVKAAEEDKLDTFGRVVALENHHLAPAQLALLGLSPDDITLMIQSHTHIDHVGYMDAFAQAPILISTAERAFPRPLYWLDKQPMDWPEATYITVSEDTLIGPGFEVLFVPGHSPGQLAFSLHLPETGTILLTSDALSRASELDGGFEGAWDNVQARHHAERLLKRATRDHAMLIFGHSPEQWPMLRKAPDWYS